MTKKRTSVVGVVVLFNPDYKGLCDLIKSTAVQIQKIVLVDNSEQDNSILINDIFVRYDKLFEYIKIGKNVGIAAAQNIGVNAAKCMNATHVLLLDQDSQLPEDMVDKLLNTEMQLISSGIKVASVGPAFYDTKTQKTSGAIIIKPFYKKIIPVNYQKPERTDYLIASGSLIRIDVFDKVGLMDESLFIDLVDIEWCERCNRKGYHSFVAPDLIMDHNIGSGFTRVLGKNVVIHNDFRHYFVVRNTVYLLFKNSLSLSHKCFLLLRTPLFIVTHTMVVERKAKKIKLFIIAIKDGICRNMGKGYFS